MSTNSDPDPSDEQQDADDTPDSDEADAAEEASMAATASAGATTETTEEGTTAEAAPDADSAADTGPDAAAASTSDSPATGPPTQFQTAINGGALKTALSTVSTLVDETRIHIDASGIQMRAVDPANVGMTDLTLEAAAFESYAATPGRLGVDLERLEDIVRMATADDLVQLALNQASGKLAIHIDEVEFTMACLDPDTIRAEPNLPDLDLPATVVVGGEDLDCAVTAADMVSEHINLGVDPDADQFYATARGDTDEVRLDLDRDDLIDLVVGDADSLYSLDYLADMNTAIPGSAEVTVELGNEFPLLLSYEFADGDGHVTQMLAPRIATE